MAGQQLVAWRDRLTASTLTGLDEAAPHQQALLLLESIFSLLDAAEHEDEATALGTPEFVSSLVVCCRHEALARSALWVLVRMGRRQLDKATAHADNLALMSARCVDILGAVQPAWLGNAGGHLVAHPLCYLIMILASDNDANQLALVQQAGAHEVVAASLRNHCAYPSVAEMALRAGRNLAACDDNAAALLQAGLAPLFVQVLTRYRPLVSQSLKSPSQAISAAPGDEEEEDDKRGGTQATRGRAADASSALVVADCALWAAVNLVCDDESCDVFVESGGVSAVCGLLEDLLSAREGGRWGREQEAESEAAVHAALWCVRNLASTSAALLEAPSPAEAAVDAAAAASGGDYGGGEGPPPSCPAVVHSLRALAQHLQRPFSPACRVVETAMWCLAKLAAGAGPGRLLHALRGDEVVCRCVLAELAGQVERGERGERGEVVEGGSLGDAAEDEGKERMAAQGGERDAAAAAAEEAAAEAAERRRDERHALSGPVAEAALWCLRSMAAAEGGAGRLRMAGLSGRARVRGGGGGGGDGPTAAWDASAAGGSSGSGGGSGSVRPKRKGEYNGIDDDDEDDDEDEDEEEEREEESGCAWMLPSSDCLSRGYLSYLGSFAETLGGLGLLMGLDFCSPLDAGGGGCCAVCLAVLAEYGHREGMVVLACETMLALVAGDDEDEEDEEEEEEEEEIVEGGKEKSKGPQPTPPCLPILAKLASLPAPEAALATPCHPSNPVHPSHPSSPSYLFSALVRCLHEHRLQCDRLNALTPNAILPPMADDADLQVPVLKLLLAISKYTTLTQTLAPTLLPMSAKADEAEAEAKAGEERAEGTESAGDHERRQAAPAPAFDPSANLGTDPVSVITSSMERHPSSAMVARLGVELLAALHFRIYSSSPSSSASSSSSSACRAARQDEGAEGAEEEEGPSSGAAAVSLPPPRLIGRLPRLAGGGSSGARQRRLLEQRGLLVGGAVQLGGKSMAQVLHAWLPERYPPAPPPADDGREEEEG